MTFYPENRSQSADVEFLTRRVVTLTNEAAELRVALLASEHNLHLARCQLSRSEERRMDLLVRGQKSHEQASQVATMVGIVGGWVRQIQQCADSVSSRARYPGQYKDKCKDVVRLAGLLEDLLKVVK